MCVMSVSPAKISTTVRLYARYQWLRLGFRLGGLLRPQATLRRAGDLFCTPLPNSRTRALAASTGAALEADLDLDGLHIHTYVWGDPQGQPYVLFAHGWRSEEHTSELQSLMRLSYTVFCLKKKQIT